MLHLPAGMLLEWRLRPRSSEDRMPRRAILLAVSPTAAPYRASGLVHWHLTDVVRRMIMSGVRSNACAYSAH